MVGKRALTYEVILSSLPPAYPPYKSGLKVAPALGSLNAIAFEIKTFPLNYPSFYE